MEVLRYLLLGFGLFLLAFGCVGVAWSAVARLRKRRSSQKVPPKRASREDLDDELGDAVADIEAFRQRFQVVPEAAQPGGGQVTLPKPVVLRGAVPAPPKPPTPPPAVATDSAAPAASGPPAAVTVAASAVETPPPEETNASVVDDELMALFDEVTSFKAAPAPIREAIEDISTADLLAQAREVHALLQSAATPQRGRA